MTDALTWSKGNRYTYRVRPCTYMQTAMLANVAVTLPAKTYVTVAPNDADGQTAVQAFKQLVAAKRPDITFVGAQFPTPGQFDPAAVVGALGQPAPDAIFSALLGPDLLGFVREGDAHGLFNKRTVFSLLTGEPEYLGLLGAQTPVGWVVTGYPWSMSDEPSNKQFVLDYMLRYHEPPGMGSVIGSALMSAIVSGMLKSGSANTEAMADGFADSAFTTAFGICNFRAIDHQSTLGSYVGRPCRAGWPRRPRGLALYRRRIGVAERRGHQAASSGVSSFVSSDEPLRDVIARHGLDARKSLGQHFLLDLRLTAYIASLAGDITGRHVLEVGPGPGGLTRALLATPCASVTAVEIDRRAVGRSRNSPRPIPGSGSSRATHWRSTWSSWCLGPGWL